jgi:hypothetical protein
VIGIVLGVAGDRWWRPGSRPQGIAWCLATSRQLTAAVCSPRRPPRANRALAAPLLAFLPTACSETAIMMRGGMPGRLGRRASTPRLPRIAVVVLTLLVSCTGGSVPVPRFPQVEQATEAMHGGGERYRDHRTCMQASTSALELVQCMYAAHWHFVPHGSVFPEPECWQAREREQLEHLAPHCFIRAPEHP